MVEPFLELLWVEVMELEMHYQQIVIAVAMTRHLTMAFFLNLHP